MDDVKILEAVERYIRGEMKPDERVYFEQLRKDNQEVDQMVVEHTVFLHQVNELAERKEFRSTLQEVHTDLAEKDLIHSAKLKGNDKVIYLWNRYKRVAAIAASIAGITALTFSGLVVAFSPKQDNQKLQELDRKLSIVTRDNVIQKAELNNIKRKIDPASFTSGGTGFLIDGKGYLVTNEHVIKNAKNIAVQNSKGIIYNAIVIHQDAARDIAILKIADDSFRVINSIPYNFKKSSTDLAEPIFTMGFPRNEIVYGEGYLSSKTGFLGDTLTCQIAIAANPGNSGSPVLNKNGEVIGLLSTRQKAAEGVVFAIQSKYINKAIEDLKKADSSYQNIRMPSGSLKGIERTEQVKKLEDYIFMVKIN
ncbi:MAG: trypsin-like serine protease [Terrimonas sp.]|nr:trypsin-like serine protease [Terrimonas sp.]